MASSSSFTAASRLRTASTSSTSPPTSPTGLVNSRRTTQFKEKIVQMYDILGRGEDPEESVYGGDRFWTEFFLLKPKIIALEAEIAKTDPGCQTSGQRRNLNLLFEKSVDALGSDHSIRVVYALQTLCGTIKAVTVTRKIGKSSSPSHLGGNTGFDLVNLLIGFDQAEQRMHKLLNHLNEFLIGAGPASLKELCLKLLLVLTTAMDNVCANTLLEYVMVDSVYESLIHLLSNPESRGLHGSSAVLLLTILVQYRKYESTNPYSVKLSILDQELSLHGYGQVITSSLQSYNQSYESSLSDQNSGGWFSSFTSMVGNMFVSDEGSPRIEQMKARNSILLALYEAVHVNRNFMSTLAHYQTETADAIKIAAPASAGPPEQQNSPSNLLVAFLEYCSIVMQDIKTDSSVNTVKLSFLILMCITEDPYANALIHDANLAFRVKLHKAPMRHRKLSTSSNAGFGKEGSSRALACAVIDLMVEFIRSHLMKRLPHELYRYALSIIHRLLSYQKRSRVRLSYQWKELWTAMITLLKFLVSNESNLIKKMNIFHLAQQIVTIFNLFVTYGDTCLPCPSSYDELYYEMVRCHSTFDCLHAMALRYSTSSGGEYKESALKLTSSLANIRAITSHFNPKIDSWLSAQQLSTPTEDQILEVVKSNYDSLTLKLQEGLDQFDRYYESPKHTSFFTTLVRSVVVDSRLHVILNDLELQQVLQDFSTIQ